MPKTSGYAIALGVNAQPGQATDRDRDRRNGALVDRNVADGFYFQLESFLDNWRRQGMAEEVVRAALERAKLTSLAMENVGKLLKGR
jgi:hypothetical protein